MNRSAWSRRIKLVLLGALSFWLPDVLVHAIGGFDLSDAKWLPLELLGMFVMAAGLPLCLLAAYSRAKRSYGGRVGTWMLLGVWLLGGFFMQVSASFSGGGFASGPLRETAPLIAMSVLPPVTFMMATYDGSLLALMLVTVAAAVIGIVQVARRTGGPAASSSAQ